MTAETLPTTIEGMRQFVGELPDIVIAGECIDRNGPNWQEWREVYVAPKEPAYTLRRIRTVYDRLLRVGFRVCNNTYENEFLVGLGSVNFDEGRKRIIVSVYPDETMARESFAWDTAYREGRFPALIAEYKASGKPEPAKYSVPRGLMRRKEWTYQARRIASRLPLVNRLIK